MVHLLYLVSDDVLICEELAENFSTFLVSLTSHFGPLSPDDNLTDLEVPKNDFLVDGRQIYDKLPDIKIRKSPGLDIFPIITDVYNTSMKLGVFPAALEKSTAEPVPKLSTPTNIKKNFRPVSLTPQIAKVNERLCTR